MYPLNYRYKKLYNVHVSLLPLIYKPVRINLYLPIYKTVHVTLEQQAPLQVQEPGTTAGHST